MNDTFAIDPTPPVDTQDWFNRVHAYFSAPGAELARVGNPQRGDYTCSYRTEDGRGCAVGCTMPDELYDPLFENKAIAAMLDSSVMAQVIDEDTGEPKMVSVDTAALRDFYRNVSPVVMAAAQSAHDSVEVSSPRDFIVQLELIARNHNLDIPF